MISLHKVAGYDTLVKHFEKNKDKSWKDWLEIDKIFPRPGKQGLVGTMRLRSNTISKEANNSNCETVSKDANNSKLLPQYVFKISKYINYLAEHEYVIMNSLKEIADFCPNFCRSVGLITCDVNPKNKENPFEKTEEHLVERSVLLMERLTDSYKFYNYLSTPQGETNTIYSSIKQVLLAILISQKLKQFTHYDLHSNNVLMKKCDKNLVMLYVIDDDNQFCVPTYGHYPTIIDFGFSYSKDLDDGPLWPSLNHTNVGFLSNCFDPIADPKLFLISVSEELKEYQNDKYSSRLSNIVKNLFYPLSIDWDSGWDNDTKSCATDHISDYLSNHISSETYKDSIFTEYPYYCYDILQSLIILPLQPQKYKNFVVSYKTFVEEFGKIEKEISSPFYNIYVLKGMVDAAREIRLDYQNNETRKRAVKYFTTSIYERIDSVAKFCKPKDVHFEKMLCSLYCLTKGMEGLLYESLEERLKVKRKMYKRMPIQNIEEIISMLEINIPSRYDFSKETTVMIINAIDKTCSLLTLTEDQIREINEYETLSRGPELYRILGEWSKKRLKKSLNSPGGNSKNVSKESNLTLTEIKENLD